MIARLLCWWNGWRTDHEGWIVRARRATDPTLAPDTLGFVEESAIAVGTRALARRVDKASARNARMRRINELDDEDWGPQP